MPETPEEIIKRLRGTHIRVHFGDGRGHDAEFVFESGSGQESAAICEVLLLLLRNRSIVAYREEANEKARAEGRTLLDRLMRTGAFAEKPNADHDHDPVPEIPNGDQQSSGGLG